MRRVILLILAFDFLLITGCSNRAAGTAIIAPTPENTISGDSNTETASPEPSTTPSSTDNGNGNMENQWSSSEAGAALAAYKAVLDNHSEFYSIENKKNVLFDDFLTNEEIYVTVFKPVKFTILDMDGDQIPEVVIALQPPDMFELLHYTKGELEGSMYSNRELGQLKADGTFHWSGSAFYNGYGKLVFVSTDEYKTVDIGYLNVKDNNGVAEPTFFIDDQPVTEDEYDSFVEEQMVKPDAAWHAFSQENIDAAFQKNIYPAGQ